MGINTTSLEYLTSDPSSHAFSFHLHQRVLWKGRAWLLFATLSPSPTSTNNTLDSSRDTAKNVGTIKRRVSESNEIDFLSQALNCH
jgi:hypothetical protein